MPSCVFKHCKNCSQKQKKEHGVSLHSMLALLAALTCATLAYAQPFSCINDNQCHSDFYCDGQSCQQCLHCEDFKREDPSKPIKCIRSVSECGLCLKGLVVDRTGGADSECVPPDAEGETLTFIYVIAIIAILVFIICIVAAAVYVCKKKDNVRISVGAFLPSYCTPAKTNASAPEPPPPYNLDYTAVRPESPGHNWNPPELTNEQEGSFPLVKRAPTSRRAGDREAEANQNAIGYNPPHYVRLPGRTATITPIDEDSNNPDLHDQETVPHDWSPNASTDDANGNTSVVEASATPQSPAGQSETASSLSGMLAQARDTTLVVPPPKKVKRSDSNNNGNRETTNAAERGDTSGSSLPPPANITLNIMVNQRNNNY